MRKAYVHIKSKNPRNWCGVCWKKDLFAVYYKPAGPDSKYPERVCEDCMQNLIDKEVSAA